MTTHRKRSLTFKHNCAVSGLKPYNNQWQLSEILINPLSPFIQCMHLKLNWFQVPCWGPETKALRFCPGFRIAIQKSQNVRLWSALNSLFFVFLVFLPYTIHSNFTISFMQILPPGHPQSSCIPLMNGNFILIRILKCGRSQCHGK